MASAGTPVRELSGIHNNVILYRHRFTHLRVIAPQAQMATQQGFDAEHRRFCH